MDDVCLAMVISSNACLDVLAVHDDAVARSHRTTVPCSVDGGPCARKEPAAEWETCLHRIALARKGQDEALRAADRLHVVVEDRETHRGTRGVKSPSPATPHRFYISPRRLTPGRCSRAGSPEVESGMWA